MCRGHAQTLTQVEVQCADATAAWCDCVCDWLRWPIRRLDSERCVCISPDAMRSLVEAPVLWARLRRAAQRGRRDALALQQAPCSTRTPWALLMLQRTPG